MDRLTLEVLAVAQPHRAIRFATASGIGSTVECAACALKALTLIRSTPWRVDNALQSILQRSILRQSEVCGPPEHPWMWCHCGVRLQFTD